MQQDHFLARMLAHPDAALETSLPLGEPARVVIVDASSPPPTAADEGTVAVALGTLPHASWRPQVAGLALTAAGLARAAGEAWVRTAGVSDLAGLQAWCLATGAVAAALVGPGRVIMWGGRGEASALAELAAGFDGGIEVREDPSGPWVLQPGAGVDTLLMSGFDPAAVMAGASHCLRLQPVPEVRVDHEAAAVLAALDHDVRSPGFALRLAVTLLDRTTDADPKVLGRIGEALDEILALVAAARAQVSQAGASG